MGAHSPIILNPILMGLHGEGARCQEPTEISASYSEGILRSDASAYLTMASDEIYFQRIGAARHLVYLYK